MKKAYRVTIWCENGYPYTPQWFRKLEKATYDSIAYRYICANTHPDHDTTSPRSASVS